LEISEGLWTVTLDRPDKANAVNTEMPRELKRVFAAAGEARASILTGVGKAFGAGAGLEEIKEGTLATSSFWEEVSGALAALPGLTIATLNGTLAGGGNGMALACDLRIAVPEAKVFYPAMKLGYMPQPSEPGRMAAPIGPARTEPISMGGQKIAAEEAYDFGLIDRVVPKDDLLDTAREIAADTLARKSEIAEGIEKLRAPSA